MENSTAEHTGSPAPAREGADQPVLSDTGDDLNMSPLGNHVSKMTCSGEKAMGKEQICNMKSGVEGKSRH